MFALRNKGDEASILALAEGLKSKNALFRHEIAYVLGQIQSPLVTNQLLECLRDENEMAMVRIILYIYLFRESYKFAIFVLIKSSRYQKVLSFPVKLRH